MMIRTYKNIFLRTGIWIAFIALFSSCDKPKNEPVEIYPDSPPAKVKFLDAAPNPSIGAPGSEVTFQITGLGDKMGKFTFFLNQTESEVLGVTENSVTIRVPSTASTGGSSILIDGEYYFGPSFTIRGKVSIDPAFRPDTYKSNGGILEISDWSSDQYILTGSFTNYQSQATATKLIPGIVRINKNDLSYNGTGSTESQFKVGKTGIQGMVNTVVQVENGRYLIAGSLSKYDTVQNINSITRINQNGSIDSMIVDVVGEPPLDKMTVPAFNGGVGGNILKAFYNPATKDVTVIGNFSNYINTFYERSSVGGLLNDFIEMNQIVRMKENGAFDSSFNYNKEEKRGYPGGNGFIYDAIRLSNGDFLVAGNFTTYHGATARYLARISGVDGSVVTSFNAGTDGPVNRLIKNPNTGNILVVGNFKTFNGQSVNQVAVMNEQGERVPGLTIAETDGVIGYAGQLKNGKVIISGSFSKYGGIVREGLAILNSDGSLAEGYNNFGLFRGNLRGIIETTTSAGQPALILYGFFDKFDNKQVGNIVKIRIED